MYHITLFLKLNFGINFLLLLKKKDILNYLSKNINI